MALATGIEAAVARWEEKLRVDISHNFTAQSASDERRRTVATAEARFLRAADLEACGDISAAVDAYADAIELLAKAIARRPTRLGK